MAFMDLCCFVIYIITTVSINSQKHRVISKSKIISQNPNQFCKNSNQISKNTNQNGLRALSPWIPVKLRKTLTLRIFADKAAVKRIRSTLNKRKLLTPRCLKRNHLQQVNVVEGLLYIRESYTSSKIPTCLLNTLSWIFLWNSWQWQSTDSHFVFTVLYLFLFTCLMMLFYC